MISFDFDKDCCGCHACMNACPVNAIKMEANKEGFLLPNVDGNTCIKCGKCDKACPHLNGANNIEKYSPESFRDIPSYLYFLDSKEREDSASGGFVVAAMKSCLDRGGLVCGCVWDKKMKAIHIVSDKIEDLRRMQSSKYVQSEIGQCYSEIKNFLKQGRNVVFCGTPCQTAGLKTFLGKVDTSNLISICVICHGTPSPLAWKKWKLVQEHKYKGKLVYVNMRDKHKKGYATTCCKYVYDVNGSRKVVERAAYIADPYVFLFADSLYLRNSCYHCQYKADGNGADIIAGDFHASIKEAGKWGCSSVFAMTQKGENFIQTLPGYCIMSDYKKLVGVNPMLWKSEKMNSQRKVFFEAIQKNVVSESDFTQFLPKKYYVKKVLEQMGLFNVVRKMLK